MEFIVQQELKHFENRSAFDEVTTKKLSSLVLCPCWCTHIHYQVTQLLISQNLPSLQERRRHLRLAFLFKLVEGSVPAVCTGTYLTHKRQRRAIRVRGFTDHITSNILDSQVTNNSQCYKVPSFHTERYRHSFFVKTVIDWNHLADDIVAVSYTHLTLPTILRV